MCSSSISNFFFFPFKSQRRTLCIHPETKKKERKVVQQPHAVNYGSDPFLFTSFTGVSTGSERRIISSSLPHPSGTLPSHCGMGRQHPLCVVRSRHCCALLHPNHQLRDVHTQTYHYSLSVFTRKKHISSRKRKRGALTPIASCTHTRAESIPSTAILSGKEV